MEENVKVGFFGLSHLGIVSSISMAGKNVECIAVDLDSQLIDALISGKWPIEEPGIDEAYTRAKDHIKFYNDASSLKHCDVIYISEDVPTDEFGVSDLSNIETLIEIVSQIVSSTSIIVILCQVPPGFSRKMRMIHPNIAYQVETLVFGQAFSRAENPERIIVGLENQNENLNEKFEIALKRYSCPILIMNYESAELTKLAINAFLAASVTTTNALNEIAMLVGANWTKIKQALQLDRRIGHHAYLNPGLGISGGNIERDLETLDTLALFDKNELSLFKTFLQKSQKQKNWIVDKISNEILSKNPKAKIGILGIAYKENTHSTKNSVALNVMSIFPKNIEGFYDPMAIIPMELSNFKVFKSAEECILMSDAIVVLTPWAEFSRLVLKPLLKDKFESFTILDPYGIVNSSSVPEKFKLIGLS